MKNRLRCISDQTKRSIVNLLYVQPTPLAICPGYIEYVLYVCVHVCVAQGHVVKTPTVSASYLPLTVCQSFLLSNTGEAHSHTLTHSSEANMTKVDSLKLHDGPLKSSRGSWWNILQLPVIQPCWTEWPKGPPGATATETKLNVLLSVLQFSVVSVARSLARSLSLLRPLQMNSTMKSLHNSPLRRCYHIYGEILWQIIVTVNICFIFLYKPIFCSSLPSQVALQALWSCLSSFCPLFCSPSLIYCELISKVVSPLSLKIRFSFLSSFL